MFNQFVAFVKSQFNRIRLEHRPQSDQERAQTIQILNKPPWNTTYIEMRSDSHFRFLPLESGMRLTIGRLDADFPDVKVDIDLEPFLAFKYGVSRRHAVITCVETSAIYIEDLDSTNGTFIDGRQLLPSGITHYVLEGPKYHANVQRLYDGANLRLGKLNMTIHTPEHHDHSIGLYNQPSDMPFWLGSQRTWHALVLLAFTYEWQPKLWTQSGGTQLSGLDIVMMVKSLQRAISDLPPFGILGNTQESSIRQTRGLTAPHHHFGGPFALKAYLMPFISACETDVTEADTIEIR